MKSFKAILSLAATAGLLALLGRGLGPAPALGPFLSPFTGFWQNVPNFLSLQAFRPAARGEKPLEQQLGIPGLKQPVTVWYDDNYVPHLFAQNDHDLYLAQGYVTARDRLFQMELTVRSAAGRLSEVVGEQALPLDRYKRLTGSVQAAHNLLAVALADTATRQVLLAYTAGVNAWIAGLSSGKVPVEYKLLGSQPEPWTPLKCMLLLVEMTHTLSGPRTTDAALTNAVEKLGREAARELYPDYAFRETPIIPAGTAWNFRPLKTPPVPAGYLPGSPGTAATAEPVAWPRQPEGVGSNNWAMAGSKTATGLPMLAGDPHLHLTLPSIWYEMQLSTPTANAYGVTLPGAPAIIIGFNHDVAWSVTNVAPDVADVYAIRFKDASRREYFYNGSWRKTRAVPDTIRIKGREPEIDTILYTHHGPLAWPRTPGEKQASLALRWVALEPGNSFKTFYLLNRARNYADYVAALSHYVAPAQNFVFASNSGDVALWVNGKFPLKWKEQGKYILDGSRPENDWQGWIPHAHNPHVKNPRRGFVSSANQFSTDPSYPYYLNWRFAPPDRAIRINERLAAMSAATPDSLRGLQNDNFNVLARDLLPELLTLVQANDLSGPQRQAFSDLVTWNYQNAATSPQASVFEKWVELLPYFTWNDELPTTPGRPYQWPTNARLWELLLRQPKARWFDNVQTPAVAETRADVVHTALKAALDSLQKKHGAYDRTAWAWGRVKATRIDYLVPKLTAFSRRAVVNGGGPGIVNATTETHGPSWRMVVALGKDGPTAYGIYPGGQSGNPASPFYDNMIDGWAKGQLRPLLYLKAAGQPDARLRSKLVLSPEGQAAH